MTSHFQYKTQYKYSFSTELDLTAEYGHVMVMDVAVNYEVIV